MFKICILWKILLLKSLNFDRFGKSSIMGGLPIVLNHTVNRFRFD